MRRVVIKKFAPAQEIAEIEEAEKPTPGAGEVLIRITLSAIHNHDLMTIQGRYGYVPELPYVPGTEATGVVEALGEGVENIQIGQRVAFSGQGLWSEYATANAAKLIPLPDAISDESAAQLIAMPLSTMVMLEELDVKEGDWIIQNGANGAVGKFVNQFAPKKGINVINLVRRESAVKDLEALGCKNIVVTTGDDWKEKAKALSNGAPIVRALDSVGGEASDDLCVILSDNGQIISFGAMSGEKMHISPGRLLFKSIIAKGFWGARSIPALDPDVRARMIGELLQLVASGELHMPVDQVLDLADIRKGAELTVAPGRNGKILLKP